MENFGWSLVKDCKLVLSLNVSNSSSEDLTLGWLTVLEHAAEGEGSEGGDAGDVAEWEVVDASLARRLGRSEAQQDAVQQKLAEAGADVLGEDGVGVPAGVQGLDRKRGMREEWGKWGVQGSSCGERRKEVRKSDGGSIEETRRENKYSRGDKTTVFQRCTPGTTEPRTCIPRTVFEEIFH